LFHFQIVFNFGSKNPVLQNITDYLVEEGSFEEEELLGTTDEDKKEGTDEITIERDDGMLKVLALFGIPSVVWAGLGRAVREAR
jgi:hypothetical protein